MDLFSFLTKTTYSFEGKKEGEEVVIFLHRHWFTLFSRIVFICITAFIPFIILVIFGSLIIKYDLIAVFTLLWSGFFMMLWFFIFYTLTMYTLDTWMVTDERVINSIQHGFFNRRISELSLDNIQDVSVRMTGAIPTFLNYGNVEIQTAGTELRFLFEQIPDPQKVKDKLMEMVDKFHKEHGHHGNDI